MADTIMLIYWIWNGWFTGPHLLTDTESPLKWRTLLFTNEVYHHSVYHNEVNGSSVHTRKEAASKIKPWILETWREANDELAWKRNYHLAFTAGLLKWNGRRREDPRRNRWVCRALRLWADRRRGCAAINLLLDPGDHLQQPLWN